jgi:hypothetical protein
MDPLSSDELMQRLQSGARDLDERQARFWERVQIPPTLWRCVPHGGVWWVVGVIGTRCLHLNPHEGGLTWGRYSTWGEIEICGHDQDELLGAIYKILFAIDEGGIV